MSFGTLDWTVLGIFSTRVTPAAGFIGLIAGFAAGRFRLVLDLWPGLGEGFPLLAAAREMNWLYYCCSLLVFTIAVILIVVVLIYAAFS